MAISHDPEVKHRAAARFAGCLLSGINDVSFYPLTTESLPPGEGYSDLSDVMKALGVDGLKKALKSTYYPQPGDIARFIVDNELTGEGWKFKQIRVEDKTNGAYNALIFVKDHQVEVFFQGTPMMEWRKWRQNLSFLSGIFTAADGKTTGRVHGGFLAVTEQIRGPVEQELAALKEQQGGLDHIGISGYSQGGAVAPLFAMGLKDSLRRIAHVYTFAAPRAGLSTGGFTETMNALLSHTAVHFRADHDPVPRLPARAMNFANTPGEYIGIAGRGLFAEGSIGDPLRALPRLHKIFSMSSGGEGRLGMPIFHVPMNYLQGLLSGPWHALDISTTDEPAPEDKSSRQDPRLN